METHDEASKVEAEKGDALIDGPDGVAVTLTPEAALETSERLLQSGLAAQGQRALHRNHKRLGNDRSQEDL